jgi:hypothetical protein
MISSSRSRNCVSQYNLMLVSYREYHVSVTSNLDPYRPPPPTLMYNVGHCSTFDFATFVPGSPERIGAQFVGRCRGPDCTTGAGGDRKNVES